MTPTTLIYRRFSSDHNQHNPGWSGKEKVQDEYGKPHSPCTFSSPNIPGLCRYSFSAAAARPFSPPFLPILE